MWSASSFVFLKKSQKSSTESLLELLSPCGSLLKISATYIAGLTNRELHFGIGIILGTIPSGLPVLEVILPGCSQNDSTAYPYLRVQKTSSNLDTGLKMRDSVRLKSWDSLFSDAAFDFLWNMGDVLISHPRKERVLWLVVPSTFLCFPWNSC